MTVVCFKFFENLQFFNQPEGYVKNVSGSFSYIYQYKDHLDNIRLSYADTNNNGSITASTEIIEESNYYPFGLKHKGYNSTINGGNATAQKFKYNGIELEESLGVDWYEMDLRQYDPAIARWTGIDPVTHHSMSTYTAFDNNPVYWADPSGADGIDFQSLLDNAKPGMTTFDGDGNQTGYTSDEDCKKNPEKCKKTPRSVAYEMYSNRIKVLPQGNNLGKDILSSFWDGTSTRYISIGGERFYVDYNGYLMPNNFHITVEVPPIISMILPGGQFKFVSSAKAFIHYAKHVKNIKYVWKTGAWKAIKNGGSLAGEFKSFSAYVKGAQKFFTSNGSNFVTYVNKQGSIFKMNLKNGHFGVANNKGEIQTFFKLDLKNNKAINYFIEQVKKY